jgi:hypothetical protein
MGMMMMDSIKDKSDEIIGIRIEHIKSDTPEDIEEKYNLIKEKLPAIKEDILKVIGDKNNRYMGIAIISCINIKEDEPTHKIMVIPLIPDIPPHMTIEKAMNIYKFDRYLHKLILKKEFDNIIKHYEDIRYEGVIENDV